MKKEICVALGDQEGAKESLELGLKLAREYWRESQIDTEYYLIEELESDLDSYFDEDTTEKRRDQRFIQYAYGLLYFIGAAPFNQEETSPLPANYYAHCCSLL